eukprot:4920209-Pyramimonas_sp.AAC.1
MQQAEAPDVSESIPVINSPADPLQPELIAENDCTSEDHWKNTNSFADLARAADRVESSECDRRTRLMSPNRFQ